MSKRFINMPSGKKFEKAKGEFEELVALRGWTLVDPYSGSQTKIRIICPNGHLTDLQPGNFKQGSDCRSCKGLDKIEVAAKFIRNIAEQGGTVQGRYVDATTRVACTCSKGHACMVFPASINRGCHMCQICTQQSQELAEQRFREAAARSGITVEGQYVNRHTPIRIVCSNGHVTDHNAAGRDQISCRICLGMDNATARKNFTKCMEAKGYQVLEPYQRRHSPVKCKCPQGHVCFIYPACAYEDRGLCKTCRPRSRGEDKVGKALSELGVDHIRELWIPGNRYYYDFEILGRKIIIEVDGMQHFMTNRYKPTDWDLTRGQIIDSLKMLIAFKSGYKILRIDYTWFHLPVEDYVKFIKEHIDKPWDSLPNYTCNNPSNYEWLDKLLSTTA